MDFPLSNLLQCSPWIPAAALPGRNARTLALAPDEVHRRQGKPVYRYVVHKSNFVRKTQINGTNFQVILESDRLVPMWDMLSSPSPDPNPGPPNVVVASRNAGHHLTDLPSEESAESNSFHVPSGNHHPGPSIHLVSHYANVEL